MSSLPEGDQTRRLLEAGRTLVAERDVEAVLDRILEAACEITGANYVAIGVLDESRTQLQQFLTRGIDPDTYRAIGDLPRGRGVLGVLIEDPRPLRLSDVTQHPYSYGFPAHHPPMKTFLGVPLMIHGAPWGNLYLADKHGAAEFSAQDEEAVVVLAQWAGVAIDNARLYETSERRRQQLESVVHSLEAARDISAAISGEPSLERILELIVKRGRALVDARAVLILLREGDELVVAASAGHVDDAEGRRIALARSTSGQVLERDRPERIEDARDRLRVAPSELGIPDARCVLLVPMRHHGEQLGVVAAFDRGPEQEPFTAEDEQTLRSFAGAAGNAVALNRSVRAERLHSALAAAESERGRWARELHDQTLQSLGGLRVALSAALRRGDAANRDKVIRQAIEDIESEIENLRGIISDLRPSVLDDLGLSAAVEALLDRRREEGMEITGDLALPGGRLDGKPGRDLETTVYRVVQEALTNVAKHAHADAARVSISMEDGEVRIEVEDDGVGFNGDNSTVGFGLAGIRERVSLVGGTVDVAPTGNGTLLRARLPVPAGDGNAAA